MVAAGVFAVRGVAQPAELETGEQAENTTLVAPPYAHTLGIHRARTAHLRLFLGAGVLGGFTTFSAFSLETFNMLVRGQHFLATAYAVSSVTGSVLMVVAGIYLFRALA